MAELETRLIARISKIGSGLMTTTSGTIGYGPGVRSIFYMDLARGGITI